MLAVIVATHIQHCMQLPSLVNYAGLPIPNTEQLHLALNIIITLVAKIILYRLCTVYMYLLLPR